VPELNELIHQSSRLRMMAVLGELEPKAKIDFRSLAEMLRLTDGNLGAHIMKLEEANYVRVEKVFLDRKPRTFVSLTAKGRAAFEEHVQALKDILRQNQPSK